MKDQPGQARTGHAGGGEIQKEEEVRKDPINKTKGRPCMYIQNQTKYES